jgi:hypothetical protein
LHPVRDDVNASSERVEREEVDDTVRLISSQDDAIGNGDAVEDEASGDIVRVGKLAGVRDRILQQQILALSPERDRDGERHNVTGVNVRPVDVLFNAHEVGRNLRGRRSDLAVGGRDPLERGKPEHSERPNDCESTDWDAEQPIHGSPPRLPTACRSALTTVGG